MSIRLQVLLDEEELGELKILAEQEKITVSAWVRRAIQHEKKERPAKSARKKLEIIQSFATYDFPSGDYKDIAVEIETGYFKEPLS
ncbi:MAG: hypothetical protein PF693_16090 [Spirochaetia bacterium]|nr:hypothetical protein [Spirochaetia bacterium]